MQQGRPTHAVSAASGAGLACPKLTLAGCKQSVLTDRLDYTCSCQALSCSTVWTCCQGIHLADCRQAILTDRLDFNRSCWTGISDEAKDFVHQLLQREPGERPTAREALQHPWLRGGTVEERTQGTPLSLSAVQRIQVTCLPSCPMLVVTCGNQQQTASTATSAYTMGAASPAHPASRQAVLPFANHGGTPLSLIAAAAHEICQYTWSWIQCASPQGTAASLLHWCASCINLRFAVLPL